MQYIIIVYNYHAVCQILKTNSSHLNETLYPLVSIFHPQAQLHSITHCRLNCHRFHMYVRSCGIYLLVPCYFTKHNKI